MRAKSYSGVKGWVAEDDREMYDGKNDELCGKDRVRNILKYAMRRKYHKELLDAYSELSGLRGYAILSAHGSRENGTWMYREQRRRPHPVQEWIDELDGKYAGIVITCCNPRSSKIESAKSVVLHPDGIFSLLGAIQRKVRFDMYLPGFGYAIGSRKRKKALDELNFNLKEDKR